MHPEKQESTIIATAGGGPNSTIGVSKNATPSTSPTAPEPSTTTPASTSWGVWLFNLIFSK
jgi:hypothetical protein